MSHGDVRTKGSRAQLIPEVQPLFANSATGYPGQASFKQSFKYHSEMETIKNITHYVPSDQFPE
jgi:hypothetical protein